MEWIRNFNSNDVFYDIGANIGIFSLLCASLHPQSMIYAIEPDRRNYRRLRENIALNKFNNILCFNVAMSNRNWIEKFYVPKIEIGSSGGQIRESIDEKGNRFEPEEWYFISTMDFAGLIEAWHQWPPNHIKIDVDGKELEILEGLYSSLKTVKSILIEFNQPFYPTLLDYDFTTDNRFNKMENHSRVRRAREGIKAENIIFTRK